MMVYTPLESTNPGCRLQRTRKGG